MGKKKKSVANKLAKMSEEDRTRYLQHRADMEEEARRRKQELINSYLKNKLKKEDAFMRINLAKINQEWRQILRRTKCGELKTELEAMQKAMNEAVDRKNVQINYLLNEIDECEDQYNRKYQAHLTNIDRLLRLYRDRLNDINEKYEHHKDEKVLMAVRDKIRIENTYDEQIAHLKTVLHQSDTNFKEDVYQSTERRLNSKLHMDTEIKVNNELYMKDKQNEIGQLWEKILQTLNNYIDKTNSKRKEYKLLRDKDLKEQTTIFEQNNIIKHQKELSRHLEKKLEYMQEISTKHIIILQEQKETLIKNFKLLKKELSVSESSSSLKLNNLTTISNEIIDYFRNVHKKGESIINFIKITKKYETEQEKIDPWNGYDDFVVEDSPKEKTPVMDKFWWRYSNISIQCQELKKEKSFLEKENMHLKTKLQECMRKIALDGTTRTMESSLLLIPHISVTPIKKMPSLTSKLLNVN